MASPNLNILQRLRSVSNFTPSGDAFVDKRRNQIFSGEDELAPSEFEQRQVQQASGGAFSRDMISDAGIQALKNKLRMVQTEAAAKAAGDIATEHIKGEYGVKAAQETARAAEARRDAQSADILARQRENNEAIMGRLGMTQQGLNTRQEDAQQFKVENPTGAQSVVPAQLYDAINKARASYGGPMSRIGRMLGMDGGSQQLQGALTAVLDRKGTLAEVNEVAGVLAGKPGTTIDEKIANSGIPGLQNLDPYERQYLELRLGR